jgi:hypothetical protein
VFEVEIPSTCSSNTCMIFAPSGYHEPPEGPEAMRTKVSDAAGRLTSASGAAARMIRASVFMILLP